MSVCDKTSTDTSMLNQNQILIENGTYTLYEQKLFAYVYYFT